MDRSKYISTMADLERLVLMGVTTESTDIDFKLELKVEGLNQKEKRKKSVELASDICQFANSFGGVLLVGIEEAEQGKNGKKVAVSIPGVDNFEEVSRFINDSVLPLIHPKNLNIGLTCIGTENSNQVVAVNIRPLAVGVACVCDPILPYSSIYPYRTHYGKSYLHPTEVEKRMADSYRLIPIKLEELSSSTRDVKIYPSLIKEPLDQLSRIDSKEENILLVGISKYEYCLNINGVDINIPFSLTKDVWITEKNKIGILLSISLIITSDRKELKFKL